MARRHGGRYSPKASSSVPTAAGAWRGARRTRAGGRVNLLFFVPLPLVWAAFASDAVGLVLNLGAFGLLLLAAWLTREGILAEEAYEARKVARRPALPRKIIGSLAAGDGLLASAIYAATGALLHSLAFGLDPLRDKGMDGINRFQTERVARAVDKAETYLAAMRDAVKRAGDREAEARVERFQASVRAMLRTVENDPRDLTAARRYLSIYLMGARDATVKFADLHARLHARAHDDMGARKDYFALLSDLEQNFIDKTHKLLSDDAADLGIEIEVLRDRLRREGIRPADTDQ